jgi:hypothetical protein
VLTIDLHISRAVTCKDNISFSYRRLLALSKIKGLIRTSARIGLKFSMERSIPSRRPPPIS